MFPWESYGEALALRGLAPNDVEVLLNQAREEPAMFAVKGSEIPRLLPLVHAQMNEASWSTLFDSLVETQARGPVGSPAAKVWRFLYIEGCPLDHIWRVFYHCFKDPDSDPQDWLTVEPDVALAEAQRYAALHFPHADGPWPGLGCQNTLNRVMGRIEAFASHESLGVLRGFDEVIRLRAVVSKSLTTVVDEEASVPSELRIALASSNTIIDEAPALFDWVETHSRAEAFDFARRWARTLRDLMKTTRAVHDVSGDRFVLSNESIDHQKPMKRSEPQAAADKRDALRTLIAPWDAAYLPPWGKSDASLDAILDQRDYEDPLRWLESVAELALIEWDNQTGSPRLRDR